MKQPTIVQAQRFHGRRSFTIRDEGTVACEYRMGSSVEQHTANVRDLSDAPIRRKHTATSALVAGISFAIAGAAIIGLAAIKQTTDALAFGIFFGGLCVVVAPLCLRKYFMTSYDITTFENRAGGVNVILLRDKPDPEQYSQFETALMKAILSQRDDPRSASSPGTSGELVALASLRDKAILSEDEFIRLKEAIIRKATASEGIGFK